MSIPSWHVPWFVEPIVLNLLNHNLYDLIIAICSVHTLVFVNWPMEFCEFLLHFQH